MARSRRPAEVRIGIVGCGRAAASLHAPALARVRGAVIVALSDRDPVRLDAVASSCEGASAYADYRALMDDERVDLVAVCVPVTLHAEVAAAALSAGKHVFIEKPLALTLDDCDDLVERANLAESSGIRSVVGFNLRSHRLLRQAKAVIRSGALGEIELLRTLWTADWTEAVRPGWHALRSQGGGALLEIGAHLADLWRWLLASEVESIDALSRSVAFDDQTAAFQARMTSGALVSAAVSQRTVSRNIVEVFGSHGCLRLSCFHADSLEVERVGGPSSGVWRRLGPVLDKAAKLPAALQAARGGGDFKMSYVHQWERILAALRERGAMPASVHDGRQAAAIVLAALQASRGGAAVSLGAAAPPGADVRAG
jgi:myo-inositol 2-dehydrogenase / D-chiro-inositol 1-dehydrogenase